MNIRFAPNTLYYGDCLDIMHDFPDECVDLICLDPPFNSKQQYHAIFKGSGLSIQPQIKAFDDMWLWDAESAQRVRDIKNAVANPASKVIAAFKMIIPNSQMLSYTSYMAQRLFEMYRVVKDTGSIYLHCDPTASHYLKLIMDAIFAEKNFQNEIIWHYFKPHSSKRTYPKNYDSLLYYTKQSDYVFNFDAILVEYDTKAIKRYDRIDKDGRRYKIYNNKDGTIRKSYMKTGKPENVFDIPFVQGTAKERLGYPTQKPIALYERIIKASSNRDDLVLDPFAGCGTTIEAARKNGRNAIGIDILPFALRLINRYRLLPNGIAPMPMEGVPIDYETAKTLAKSDPYKFQDWAISLIEGFASNPQKSGDEGIDGFGVIYSETLERTAIVVQVTGASGAQLAKYERLQTTIRNTNAAMGILITLDAQPSGRWTHNLDPVIIGETHYPPIQCFSIQEYYRNGERYEPPLKLPSLANPWNCQRPTTPKPLLLVAVSVALWRRCGSVNLRYRHSS